MSSKLTFIYDGQCPFCNHFAQLIELKSGISDIELKDARDSQTILPKDYDMDINGAILIRNNEILYGPSAINVICTQIKDPSDTLLDILRIVFKSKKQTLLIFPLLLWARRVLLYFKGIPRKI